MTRPGFSFFVFFYVVVYFCYECMLAFVGLDFDEIGRELVRNGLFCVEWEVKP